MRPRDPEAIRGMFDELASNYDCLNDLLSLGLHRLWKRKLLNYLSPQVGESWIDICCGTGDLAILLSKRIGRKGKILALDSATNQLEIGQRKAIKNNSFQIEWLQADAMKTCLNSNSFDGAVMAYGLRNLSDPFEALVELRRILKPNGRAGILDFNVCKRNSLREKFQKFYLRKIVVPVADKFGLREHYAYLEKSLREFPNGRTQENIALEAGFYRANYHFLALGQMGILVLKN